MPRANETPQRVTISLPNPRVVRLALAGAVWMVGAGIMPCTVHAQRAPSARAERIATPPIIDGILAEPAWGSAAPLSGFIQREPNEGTPASQSTTVLVLYDDHALYIGARLLDDDPSGIVLGRSLRDASLDDSDAFLLVLDTYRDGQNGFLFGTTPSGIQYDGQVTNEGRGGAPVGGRMQSTLGGGFNLNWDGNWQVATSRDGQGWYVEMRIPFATLRYPSSGPQTWGLNIERRIRRNNELAVWAALPRQYSIHRVSMAGTLALETPAPRHLSLTPYVLSGALKDFTVAAPETETKLRVGMDAKVGVSQSLTLDVTVNTDFAQAEVDDQQVNLTRFSLFFPEKRGFFLENAGTFAVGASRTAELFFSRRIGLVRGREIPIRAGARLSGRVGGFQLGVLTIQTGGVEEVNPATGEHLVFAPSNNYGVVRVFREMGNRAKLGGIFVSRVNTASPGDRNLTWGMDGRFGLGQNLTVDGWAALTETTGAGPAGAGPDLSGGAYGLAGGMQYVSRDWQASAGYRQIGAAFNPEVGFVNRRAYRQANARLLRHIRTPDVSWFREFRPHVSWNQFWSLGGFMESYLLHVDNHFAFANGAFFQLPALNFTGEGLEQPFKIREGIVIPPGTYHNIDWAFRANTNASAPLSLSGGWDWGGFFSGTRFGPNLSVSYRSADRFALSLSGSWFDVRLAEGRFTTAIARLNTSYSFSPNLFAETNVQYNDDTRNLAVNVRFAWLDRAGTGLFLVLNETEHTGSLTRTGIASGPLQRQLVIKYSRPLELSR